MSGVTWRIAGGVDSPEPAPERGLDAARAVAHAVLAKAGPDGLTEMVVELSSKLAEALERVAAEQG